MPLRALALIAVILVSIPICFFRPFYGIALWTVIAFLNPQSYAWTSAAFPWAAAVAVPTILGMFVFDRRFDRFASVPFALLAALWLWFTLTTLVSTQTPELAHHAADTWARWNFVSKVMLMTACMLPIVSSFERLRYLVLTIVGCFAFYVLKSLPFVITTRGEFRLFGPDLSMIADNNDFGLALNMTLPLYFFLAQTESRRWLKRWFAFLFLITIPAIFFTYSRGALVGLVLLGGLLMVRSRRGFALLPVAALSLGLALFFAPEAWKQRMTPEADAMMDASARSRLNAWAYARALAAQYPVTGGGFATFTPELYSKYAPEKMDVAYGPHSVYFQVLGEHGYVGLALYLALVVGCFVIARRVSKTARARGDQVIAGYASMFEYSLIAFLISGTFLGRAYFDYFFTIVACLMILPRVAADRWAARASETQAEEARPQPLPSVALWPQQLPAARTGRPLGPPVPARPSRR